MEPEERPAWTNACVYPTLWKPRMILFIPRLYFALLFVLGGVWYVFVKDYLGPMFTLLSSVLILIFGFIGGIGLTKNDPFFFDVLVTKYKKYGPKKLHKKMKGNLYTD